MRSASGGIRTEAARTGSSRRRRWSARSDRGGWLAVISRAAAVAVSCGVSPAAAAASAWSAQPGPASWRRAGVSCVVGSACIVVGGRSGPTLNGLTAVAVWIGTRWVEQHTPTPAGGGSLRVVSCSSRSACVAVGSGVDPSTHPLAERWNGRRWSLIPAPDRLGAVEAVSCTSVSACTAVGGASVDEPPRDVGVVVERWNGRSWVVQSAPLPGRANSISFGSVSCVTVTLCTAVGASVGGQGDMTTRLLIERWDGRRWTVDRPPRPSGSFDV